MIFDGVTGGSHRLDLVPGQVPPPPHPISGDVVRQGDTSRGREAVGIRVIRHGAVIKSEHYHRGEWFGQKDLAGSYFGPNCIINLFRFSL